MSETIFMFPGVGSHYSDMGKYFYNNFKIAKETFEEASDTLKLDFPQMCFSKEKSDELNELENSQAALLCVGIATYRVLMQETGLTPKYCIGYSLGEYSALCCAGIIEYKDALLLVRDRGLIIKEVSSKIDGTMAWIVNLDIATVEEICKEFQQKGYKVYISAYDCPDKVSISLTLDLLKEVGDKIVEHGGIMIPIKMTGPYHSPLMREAADRLREKLEIYKYKKSECKVIANRNAEVYQSEKDVINNLSLQLIQPIRWKDTIDKVIDQRGEVAVEIGPKNVLTYLLKKNTDKLIGYSVDNGRDYDNICIKLFINESDCLDIISGCMVGITSTKNYNLDKRQYEGKVAMPYERLSENYKKLVSGTTLPNITYAEDAVNIFEGVMKAKGIPIEEQQQKLKNVLGGKLFRKR